MDKSCKCTSCKCQGKTFRVTLTEFERDWGSKYFDHKDFKSFEEAHKWMKEYNEEHNNKSYVPDWYVVAGMPKEVKSE